MLYEIGIEGTSEWLEKGKQKAEKKLIGFSTFSNKLIFSNMKYSQMVQHFKPPYSFIFPARIAPNWKN